jgi:hypothetical protein
MTNAAPTLMAANLQSHDAMTFWDDIKKQSLAARREMVSSGVLVGRDDFCSELSVSTTRLEEMIRDGNIFEIGVDGVRYIPALLADQGIDLRRLHSVCRILVPAHPASRLNYLTTRHGNLGGISPIDALSDDKSYRMLRKMARAWASDWSMTTVQIFAGDINEATDLPPIYTAARQIDPRANLWKRVMKAITEGGYIEPAAPYPYLESATVFVTRCAGGSSKRVREARISLRIAHEVALVTIDTTDRRQALPRPMSMVGARSVVDAVHRIAAYEHRKASG